MTIENEAQKKIDAHQAWKQSRIDRGALAAQADEELWGHTSSAEDQGIPQSSFLESAENTLFPAQFDKIFKPGPLNIPMYTSFPIAGPSSTFRPLFPSIPTRPHGYKIPVNPPLFQLAVPSSLVQSAAPLQTLPASTLAPTNVEVDLRMNHPPLGSLPPLEVERIDVD